MLFFRSYYSLLCLLYYLCFTLSTSKEGACKESPTVQCVCSEKNTLFTCLHRHHLRFSIEAPLVLMSAPLCVFVGLFFVCSLSGKHVPCFPALQDSQIAEISRLNSHRSSLKTLSLIFFFFFSGEQFLRIKKQ